MHASGKGITVLHVSVKIGEQTPSLTDIQSSLFLFEVQKVQEHLFEMFMTNVYIVTALLKFLFKKWGHGKNSSATHL